jgi:hypothetical protein
MHPSVAFTADDTREWHLPLAGPGLLLEVPREGPWAQRPSLHFDAAPGYRLRVMSGGQPLLWLRIDGWWDRSGFLRGPAGTPWRLPAISAPEVREVTHAPGSPLWWEAWVWRAARALARPEHPLLYAGRWCLRPVQAIRASKGDRYPISTMEWRFGQPPCAPHSLEGVQRFEPFWIEDWTAYGPPSEEGMFQGAVVPLRAPSSEEDGRVKSWRKRARDGTLPPALLLYVDLPGKWLVLDGHDRIHAAVLEGISAPLLGLWPVHEEVLPSSPEGQQGVLQAAEFHLRAGATPSVVDRVNRFLLLNFRGVRRSTVTRAWPLKGGLQAWREEVLVWHRRSPVSADARDWDWFVSPRS